MATRPRARTTTRAGAAALPREDDHQRAKVLPSRASVVVGLVIFAAAGAAYTAARETPLFAVGAVHVRGATPEVRRQVEQALRSELGVSLLKVDGRVLDRRLAGVSWVAATSYDRAFPHTLVVTVRPERAVAVLRRGARSWLLSARGRVLTAVPHGARPALPRIWIGGKSAAPSPGAVLGAEQGGAAARALAPLASIHFPARVASVATGRDELTFVLRSGLELRLGDSGDLRLKLAVARRVLPQVVGSTAGAYVDVSVPERPVAAANPQVGG